MGGKWEEKGCQYLENISWAARNPRVVRQGLREGPVRHCFKSYGCKVSRLKTAILPLQALKTHDATHRAAPHASED